MVLFDLQTEAGIIGCCLFKTKCTDLILTHIWFSFTDVYVNLRHIRMFTRILAKTGILTKLCVCFHPLRRCLNRASLSLSLCLSACVRFNVCGSGWAQKMVCKSQFDFSKTKHVRMINFHSMVKSHDMRAEPWGLVRTDHGSFSICCTPTSNV